MTDPIQSFWIGGELSPMEQLSIASFLAHGHGIIFYSYGEVGGLPKGAVLKNAEEILPKAAIFQYQQHPSYSAFSNFFVIGCCCGRERVVGRHRRRLLEALRVRRALCFCRRANPRWRSGGERGDQGTRRQRNHGFQLARLFVLRGPCACSLGPVRPKADGACDRQVWARRASASRGGVLPARL